MELEKHRAPNIWILSETHFWNLTETTSMNKNRVDKENYREELRCEANARAK